MADGYISQIKTPDNKVYDFRDKNLKVYTGSCSTAAGTAIKDVVTDSAFTLEKGAVVFVNFSATNSAAVGNLKLKFNGEADTNAKPIKYLVNGNDPANIPGAGYLRANQTYMFQYDGTNWVAVLNYYTYSNDFANRVGHYNNILARKAIAAESLIVGDETGYEKVASGVTFNLAYPIVWCTGAVNANASNYANMFLQHYDRNIATGAKSGFTSTANKVIYLIVTINGNIATIDSNIITDTLPSSDDGKVYISLGKLGAQSTGANYFFLYPVHPMFWYKNGAIREYSGASQYALAAPLSGISGADDLKAIEAISGTSGLLKKTAANTWTLDTNTYLTTHRTYTAVSGKKPTSNQTPGFGSTFDIEQVGQDTTGQVSVTERTVKIPDTAASASTAGLVNTDAQTFSGIKTFMNGIEIKGHIAGDGSATTGHGLYGGGMYHNAYNNIILHGDASTGSSGIAFVSDKVSANGTITNRNAPSDRAFIQYHACGVTTATAEGTNPTLASGSEEAGRLVIGIGNDSGDKIILQAPGDIDIVHQKGATGYPIPHTTNTNGSVGGTTTPVYVEAGVIKAGTALGTASQKAESYFVKAITSTDNAIARFDGTNGQIQKSGITIDDSDNMVIGSNRILNQITVPGQGEILLSVFGFKTGYPLYTDPTFLSGTNSIGVYNNSGGGTVTHTRGSYASFEISSPGTDSSSVIKIETTGTASPGCGGFVQSIPSRANAQFVQIFRALVPVGRKLYIATNPMGNGSKDEWLTSNNGTGKWEWYARRVICGQEGTLSSGGHVYIDGAVPVTWYLASCNVYDITKTQYDGLRTRETDAVHDYNSGALTTFGYSTSGMTSTSWLGSWDGYKLRAISPTNALKSAIGTTQIGGTTTPIYWTGSAFSAGTALSDGAYKDILNNTSAGALGWNSAGNTNTNNLRLVNVNTIAYWNGAYSGTSSNLSVLGTVTTGTWNASVIGAAYGGTGQNTLQKSANALINALDTGSSDLTANDYVITQYVGGGTTTTTYHRRPASKVVNATLVKAALGTNNTHGNAFLRKDGTWQTPPYPVTSVATLTGAITASDLVSQLGLSNALHFIGITSTTLTDGSTTATLTPKTASPSSLSKTTGFVDGDVVMDSDQLREYVWSASAWRLLGITASTAYTQPASTATNTWIAQISQGTDGKITATIGSLNTSGTWSGTATKASYPDGFSSRSANATWGNQTGATVTCWNESDGGSIDIRKNNPSSGKVSIKVDGRFYGNEGNNPAMLMSDPNSTSYWGMGSPDGANNVWIRTTSLGIIPFQGGGATAGHGGIGTSSWYFASSYIQNMYGTHTGNVITSSITHRDSGSIDNGSWVTGATGTAPTATTTDGNTTYSGAIIGTSILTLGNNKIGGNAANGVANNSQGYLRLYSSGSAYAQITAYSGDKTRLYPEEGISIPVDRVGIMFRPTSSSYYTHFSYQTANNEALVMATQAAVTSFIFINGESYANVSNSRWRSLTPALQIKNNSVIIGKLIDTGVTPSYKFEVNGTSYFDGNTTVNGNLVPGANNSKNLGASNNTWAKLYIGTDASYGDAYTPIYWNDGAPAAVAPLQYQTFTITGGNSGVQLAHDAFTADSYVAQIVVTSGEANLNSPIAWASSAGTIQLTCTTPPAGDVSGYIILGRGTALNATSTDIV